MMNILKCEIFYFQNLPLNINVKSYILKFTAQINLFFSKVGQQQG